MCVAQKKSVLLHVHHSDLILYAVEQAQLVEVSQCEHSRAIYIPVFLSNVFGMMYQRG